MATCAAIFCAVNAIQYVLDPSPLFAAHGRLNATTSNPQQAAGLLGGALPAVLYFVATGRTLVRAAAVVLAIACLVLLVWTGSRTGVAMGALAILFVLRSSATLRAYAVLTGIIVLAVGLPALFDEQLIERFNVSSIEDTRSAVWTGMWQAFSENPIFGVEITGERLGFGENSWLAMASSAGIVGLIPLLAFGVSLISLCLSLLMRPYADQRDRARRDATVGCIASILLGSLFEAYLLGTLTAPVYMIVLAGIMGQRMLMPSFPPQPHKQPTGRMLPAAVDMRQ
jgi:O-antigen ligase